MKTGMWNVQDVNGKEEEIVKEMIKHRIEILGVTKTKKRVTGENRIHKKYWMMWCGVNEGERSRGVG